MCSLVRVQAVPHDHAPASAPSSVAGVVKYAGRVVPSYGISTRVVAGSSSVEGLLPAGRGSAGRSALRSGSLALCIRSAWPGSWWPGRTSARRCAGARPSRPRRPAPRAGRRRAVQAAMNSPVPTSEPLRRPPGSAGRPGRPRRSGRRCSAWRRRRGSRRSCRGSTRTSVFLLSGTVGGGRRASEIDFAPPWEVAPPSTGISAPVTKTARVAEQEDHQRRRPRRGWPARPSGVSASDGVAERRRRGGGHRGLDEAGMDGVDADAARAELQGRGVGQPAQRPLAGGVGDRVVAGAGRRASRC